MCGIVGIISKSDSGLFQNHTTVLHQMIWADQLRGTDGTGLMYNENSDKTLIIKAPGGAGNLFALKNYEKTMKAAVSQGNFIIGHNRAATKGKKIWADTHPFIEKHICLLHNGTLFNHMKLAKTDVDSHAIAIHMAENGEESTVENIDGAFAIVWADMEKKTLNFCRNEQRPLNLLDVGSAWIVCSEAELGAWIATRNNLKVESTKILTPGIMYSFNMVEKGGYDKYTEKVMKLHQFKVATNTNYHSGNYDHDANSNKKDLTKSAWWSQNEKAKSEFVPGKFYYFAGDKIRFTFEKETPEATTVIRQHHTKNFNQILGKPLGTTRPHRVVVNGPDWQLAKYDEDQDALWEATVSSSQTIQGITNDLYYVRDIKKVEAEVITISNNKQLTLVETPDARHDEVTCCICSSNIWPGNDMDQAMSCGSGQFICKTCQDDWKEDALGMAQMVIQNQAC